MFFLKKTNLSHFSYFLILAWFNISCTAQTASDETSKIDCQQITYRNQDFDIVKIDLRKTDVHFFWKNKKRQLIRSLENLKKETETDGKELLFATNAGMYQRDRNPQGLYIENGEIIKPLDTLQNGYGNFYLQPNGVFFMHEKKAGILPSTIFQNKKQSVSWATQSGPMLLIDNKIHPAFKEGSTNLNIRNGVGMISEHELVFVISQKEVNLFDFAMLFKEKLNCKNALYLDGFVSRAYIPQLNRNDLDGNFGVMIGILN